MTIRKEILMDLHLAGLIRLDSERLYLTDYGTEMLSGFVEKIGVNEDKDMAVTVIQAAGRCIAKVFGDSPNSKKLLNKRTHAFFSIVMSADPVVETIKKGLIEAERDLHKEVDDGYG